MNKRIILLPLLMLLAMLVLSCTASPMAGGPQIVVTATPTLRPEGAKIVLRVGTGDSGEGLTPHFKIIELFEAANPDI